MRKYPFIVYILYVIGMPILFSTDMLLINIADPSESELRNHVDIGPLRRALSRFAAYGVVKYVAVYVVLTVLLLIGVIISLVFLKRHKIDDQMTKKLLKLNLATQIITSICVTGFSLLSVACLFTVFTFAASFVIWFALIFEAIVGGFLTLPLYNDLRREGKISWQLQAILSAMGGFFFLALIASIIAIVFDKKKKAVDGIDPQPV